MNVNVYLICDFDAKLICKQKTNEKKRKQIGDDSTIFIVPVKVTPRLFHPELNIAINSFGFVVPVI